MTRFTNKRLLSLAFAGSLFAAAATAGTLTVPLADQGSGAYNINLGVPYQFGSGLCSYGWSTNGSATPDSCTWSIQTPNGPGHTYTGTSWGQTSAYVDASGAHAYAAIDTTGTAMATAEAEAGIYDKVYNPNNYWVLWTETYHVDASLFAQNGAVSRLTVQDYLGRRGGYPLSDGNWGNDIYQYTSYSSSSINNDYTFGIAIAPNSYQSFGAYVDAWSNSDYNFSPNYASGQPQAVTDASNTLFVSAVTVTDQSTGLQIPASDLISQGGFNYSSVDTFPADTAPEPSTWGLFASGSLLLAVSLKYLRR